VSAVVEVDGTVRPCFFHQRIGNLDGKTLDQVINGAALQGIAGRGDQSHLPAVRVLTQLQARRGSGELRRDLRGCLGSAQAELEPGTAQIRRLKMEPQRALPQLEKKAPLKRVRRANLAACQRLPSLKG
jgi:hypothetical protein